ncbi:MAG: hydrogenase maturation peptidase HycI [Candidatus Omnitrophota bacterium]|nr:hydrogenase maturation peptidase HycI [Candidatus Omnitrophota bacterium]
MKNLEIVLKDRLKSAERVAVLGIGSELRGDDIAGILVTEELGKSSKNAKRLKVINGGTAPENFTGEIKNFNPTHLVVIDSASMAKSKPGTIRLIDPGEVGNFSFCTHRLPINIMTDYLIKFIDCEIIIIGIQPKTIDFGAKCSPEIKKSVKRISNAITKVLHGG